MTTPQKPSLKGFVFGECLGRGGMATVWQARQLEPDREVAVKILNDDISGKPREVESFYAEAKFAGELDHPNIVTVFEVGCQNGRYYYVMELAAGYDTGKWLARKGRLVETDVLTVAESVAVALEYAARAIGIIHCDIKPSNIMVDGDGTVRITDMGIARLSSSQDNAGYITGTPGFMSPEQAMGVEDLDSRADIYSLGATIYNLLSGHPPFHGEDDEKTMRRQCHDHVADLRRENPMVSRPCAALVSHFMEKDRANRPKDWPAALAMIRDVLAFDDAASRGESPAIPDWAAQPAVNSTMWLDGDGISSDSSASNPAIAASNCGLGLFWLWIAIASVIAFAAAFAVARLK